MERIVTRAIILNEDKRVLLGKRANGGMGAGQWALVGGKPDEGEFEPFDKTIIREVKEELGVDFPNPIFWKDETDTNPNIESWHVYYFYGPVVGELKPEPGEISEARYFLQQELKNIDIAFNHKKILIQFFQENVKP